MNALLLVAHGSRRPQSNNEVLLLTQKLKNHCSQQYPIIHGAFLELADPTIPDGIQQCITDGATTVVVLPYFLNSGSHVTQDVPAIIETAQSSYPMIDIKLAQHLGASEMMLELLISSANQAL